MTTAPCTPFCTSVAMPVGPSVSRSVVPSHARTGWRALLPAVGPDAGTVVVVAGGLVVVVVLVVVVAGGLLVVVTGGLLVVVTGGLVVVVVLGAVGGLRLAV